MASQTKSPGTITEGNIYGTILPYHWTDVGNVGASDDAYAVTTVEATNWYTYNPLCTNFGFTIPAGASIDKIEVLVEGKQDGTSYIDWCSLMYNGLPILMHADCDLGDITPASNLVAADAVYTIVPTAEGDPLLWGHAWTVAEVNDATFGCALDCYQINPDTISLDHIQIRITYTEDATIPTSVCDGLTCDDNMSLDQALKAIIGHNEATAQFEECTRVKMIPYMKKCTDLTDLVNCGTKYNLEQAFKSALIADGCGGWTLRAWVLPAGGGDR